ncbi:peptidase MA family metallohydrolase [Alkaliphilus hydrothermalis]|uniref:Peptidase MA-like domain-containing protein n=1 Tax=Alkaliphilus hydrothermalis TaxID=1482730 RepID=A0ABS2NRF8_9FIRM|nr:hypothetical protein [Alkaliphilus hydrothermalis]MBM7615545.1 hypothetical protein [Alkaliphilus hydrothermalis]
MEKVLTRKRPTPKWKPIMVVLFACILLIGVMGKGKMIAAVNPAIRYFEHQMVAFQVRNYNQLETDNFIIKYQEVDKEVLDLVAETAEDKFNKVVKLFKYQPNEKILLILYDNPQPMMKITTLRKGTPPMGVYYGDTLHILDPNHWVSDGEELTEIFYKEGPVLHELVHLFVDHLAKGNFPIWFTEGVSLYFEYEVDEYQWGEGIDLSYGEYTLQQLTDSFHELDQYMAYTKSFRLVKSYVEENGLEALIGLVNDLGEGKDIEDYYHLFKE